ncbi:NF038104 family lipoprotein [Acinetobacter junii]|uniref:NF038104 family lipoprotein n=1 Tax=Acinetobacter junii TaxID=40215 RepID=A0AAX1MIU1_ACIJU|nr:NF038104 family lipoprotein [Acinetobacter junii]QUY37553.1 NF038104 family lipoprotein [Acinetobacter junii]
MKKSIHVFAIVMCVFMLQGCIHKLITVPVKVAYKTTKGVVKGTAAVVGAVIPDDEEQKDDEEDKD